MKKVDRKELVSRLSDTMYDTLAEKDIINKLVTGMVSNIVGSLLEEDLAFYLTIEGKDVAVQVWHEDIIIGYISLDQALHHTLSNQITPLDSEGVEFVNTYIKAFEHITNKLQRMVDKAEIRLTGTRSEKKVKTPKRPSNPLSSAPSPH
jgi:hypothetical protein